MPMKTPREFDRRGRRIVTWTRTAAGRAFARSLMIALNRKRHLKPKCGAKAKSTGEPCKQIAMPNGRCIYHGGATPSGDGWHKTRWPKADVPDSDARLSRKLRDIDRAARKREKRLAAMTADKRERHLRWQATHRPGSSARRTAARSERKQSDELAAVIAVPSAPRSPELEALDRLMDEAKRRAAALENNNDELGIFG